MSYTARRESGLPDDGWVVRTEAGAFVEIVRYHDDLAVRYPDIAVFFGDYEPLLALGVRLHPRDAAMLWVEQHESYFMARFGEDTVCDIRWAIVGDAEAARRAVRAIAPTAAVWFDGDDGESYRVSYWNGAARGWSTRSMASSTVATSILAAGIAAYAAGAEVP